MYLKEKNQEETKTKTSKKIAMKKLKKQVKGITLIALVVTIIVLLILAGVALNLTIGQNGIFSRAQGAANTWRNAEANEQLALQEGADLINSYLNGSSSDSGENEETIEKTESYVGYYADIEGDGTVDGIIYADLAVGNTGDGQWTNSDGYYIPTKTNLKDYYIIQEEYTDDFGTKPVIAPLNDSGKEDRFYVMALDDFDSSSHYWYKIASGNMSDYSTATSGDFGKGKENTGAVIEKWNLADNGGYGVQNSNDIWGLIQEEVEKGWFIPSSGEWSAFAEELKISEKNYANYELRDSYWSSSQCDTYNAYNVDFLNGYINNTNVHYYYYVRLSTTF